MKVTVTLTEKRSSRQPIQAVYENVRRQQVLPNGNLVLDLTQSEDNSWTEEVYAPEKWKTIEIENTDYVRSPH